MRFLVGEDGGGEGRVGFSGHDVFGDGGGGGDLRGGEGVGGCYLPWQKVRGWGSVWNEGVEDWMGGVFWGEDNVVGM